MTSTSNALTKLAIPVEKSKTILDGDVLQWTQPPSANPDRIPKGRNVSGRSWKAQRPQKRASSLIKTRFNNQSKEWQERQTLKRARQETRELQKEMENERREEALRKKERRLENEKRRAENQYKSMQKSVQTLNTAKIGTTLKAMSKKQLRMVKKTRLNPKTGVVEYVSAYAK